MIKQITEHFEKDFLEIYKKPFNHGLNNGETGEFLNTVLNYLLINDDFYESKLLNKSINEPSLSSKGLFVIGGLGNGKTSTLKAVSSLCSKANSVDSNLFITINDKKVLLKKALKTISFYSTNKVVEMYEVLDKPHDKQFFWSIMTKPFIIFDDILTEREASNYGKFEVFKDIFEKRYELGSRTIITVNYVVKNNIESTLAQVMQKYGPRVYDRFFEMFNFIELKGHSLRK